MERNLVLMVLRQGRPISTYPSVVNAARLWKEAGWDVDIITNTTNDAPDPFRRFQPFSGRMFPVHMAQVMWHVMRTKPAVVIAYEPIDAELCSFLYHLHAARYIYHNIELRYPGCRYFRIHQALERAYYRHCDTVICQDELRLGELRRLLKCASTDEGRQFFCVPNTYFKEDLPEDRYYLHRALGLPPSARILLYVGAIQRKKIPVKVVIGVLEVLPPDWCLVLSGWSVDGYAEELVRECKSPGTIFCHLETVPEKDFRNLVASAAAGLVWYCEGDADPNEWNIGLSSGKFWRFLTLGKPMVVSDRPGMGQYAKSTGTCVVLDDITGLLPDHFRTFSLDASRPDAFFYESHYAPFLESILNSSGRKRNRNKAGQLP